MSSVLAKNITVSTAPGWLLERSLERINGRQARTARDVDWRFLFHLAIDECGLRAPYRAILHVLTTFEPGSEWAVSTIAHRAGIGRQTCSRMLADLNEWGWVFTEHQSLAGNRPGRRSRYELLVPVDDPPDRVHAKRVADDDTSRSTSSYDLDAAGPERVANGDTYVSQTETPVSQMATPRVADGDTRNQRNQGTNQERTFPHSEIEQSDARWLWVVRRTEERAGEIITNGRDRRLVADVICGFHGMGVEHETVDGILGYIVERMMVDGDKLPLAIAGVFDISVDDVFAYRQDHHADKNKRGAA